MVDDDDDDDGVRLRTTFHRVLISVHPHLPGPVRALSLTSLMDDDNDPSRGTFPTPRRHPHPPPQPPPIDCFCVYRCPSLTALDQTLTASARTVSTTNLETDLESLSPRVSTTTLSQDFDRDHFALSLSSMPYLARSTSEGVPQGGQAPQTDPSTTTTISSVHSTVTKTDFLSPHVTARRRKSSSSVRGSIGRSISCPAFPVEGFRQAAQLQAAMWVYRHRGTGGLRPQPPGRPDVSLEGEEIVDLPIKPRCHFPDFVPEVIEDEPEKMTSYSLERNALYRTPTDRGQQQQQRGGCPGGEGPSPPSGLPGATEDRQSKQQSHQRAPRLVQMKCLQWLNSLDGSR